MMYVRTIVEMNEFPDVFPASAPDENAPAAEGGEPAEGGADGEQAEEGEAPPEDEEDEGADE